MKNVDFYISMIGQARRLALSSPGMAASRYRTVSSRMRADSFRAPAQQQDTLRRMADDCDRMARDWTLRAAPPPARRGGGKQDPEGELRIEDFVIATRPTAGFSSVAGLDGVKKRLHDRVVLTLRYPELAKKYKVASKVNLILYGPPGTGKTTLAAAAAAELGAELIVLDTAGVLSKWVGQAEKSIKLVYEYAYAAGHPVVIFIDEIESLGGKRGRVGIVGRRIATQLLQELDGIKRYGREGAQVVCLGATNRPWDLDSAFCRPPRFQMVYVPPPDLAARKALFKIHLAGRETAPDVSCSELAQETEGYSGADVQAVVEQAAESCMVAAIRGNLSPIAMSALREAIKKCPPTIRAEDIRKIKDWETGLEVRR